MPRIAAIGAPAQVQGFALAGVEICPATGPDAIRAAWAGLAEDVAVVVLTPTAADALDVIAVGDRLTVVIPE